RFLGLGCRFNRSESCVATFPSAQSNRENLMQIARAALIAALPASLVLASPAQSKGCIRGAVAGAVAGQVAHHHAVMGAAAGCVAGHYYYKHKAKQQTVAARKPRYAAINAPR